MKKLTADQKAHLFAASILFLSAIFMSWVPAYGILDSILNAVLFAPMGYEEVVIASFGFIVMLSAAMCCVLVVQSEVFKYGRTITKDDFKDLGGKARKLLAVTLGVVGVSSFFSMIALSAILTEAELMASKSVNDPILVGSALMIGAAILLGISAPTTHRKSRPYARVRDVLAQR